MRSGTPSNSRDFHLPPIYPITDKRMAGKSSHLAIVRELIRGGATLIQVRDKETPVRELLLDLYKCVEYCKKRGVILIVNDRCDLALSSGADGVHLGQADLPPAAAREILGGKALIGFSTHSPAEVRRSNTMPINYLGFGPVFSTTTKENPSPVVGIAGLRRICRGSSRPVIAIGGIGLEQVRQVLSAGASSAAVISSLMKAGNLAQRMEDLLEAASHGDSSDRE